VPCEQCANKEDLSTRWTGCTYHGAYDGVVVDTKVSNHLCPHVDSQQHHDKGESHQGPADSEDFGTPVLIRRHIYDA
jgi:hypothetical protein